MGAELKFIISGDATNFEANMQRADRAIQKSAQNAFVASETWAKKSSIDPEKSRLTGIEDATRSIRARALRRGRVEAEELRKGLLLEQNLRDQAAVIEVQREEARRNIRARALRRQRLEARMQGPDLSGAMRQQAMMAGGGSLNKGIGGAAAPMLISVMRDTAASLASGANPLTVFMQQAPQVLQAMSMMGVGVKDFIKLVLQIPVGPWISTLGIIAGIAAGAAVAYLHVKALVDKLSGVKMPDLNPEYIAKHLQKMNAVAEAWKDVNKAVKEAAQDYNSVAKAAERTAEASKKHFDHLRKMNDNSNAPARQKAARALEIDQLERAANLEAKKKEAADLTTSARAKMAEAEPILKTTSTRESLRNNLEAQKAELAAMEAAQAKIEADKKAGGLSGRNLFRTYNALQMNPYLNPGGGLIRKISGGEKVTAADLDAAEEKVRVARNEKRQHVKNLTDEMHDKEEALAKAEKLKNDAKTEFSRAAVLNQELKTDPAKNAQAAADAAAESRAKLAQSVGAPAQLTEREKIGAGITGPAFNIQNQQLEQQKKTAAATAFMADWFKRRDAIGSTNNGDTVHF